MRSLDENILVSRGMSLYSLTAANREQPVTFVDWDDTILASTVLTLHGVQDSYLEISAALQNAFSVLEKNASNFFTTASQYGTVVVVTNADAGWVDVSARRLMPKLHKVMSRLNVKIVSAKSAFGSAHTSPTDWKLEAFKHEVRHLFPEFEEVNIIAIGDSKVERDAAHRLAHDMPRSRVKAVKFVDSPTLEMLNNQLIALKRNFDEIWKADQSTEIRFR